MVFARGLDAHRSKPAHTTGFDVSNSTLYPYNAVPAATKTLAHPNANRTSVCRYICLNKSGLDKNYTRTKVSNTLKLVPNGGRTHAFYCIVACIFQLGEVGVVDFDCVAVFGGNDDA